MRLRPRTVQGWIFRATIVATLACGGYLLWRFETVTLPGEGCSPLLRFVPGQRLVVDRRPSRLDPGDALFFEAPDGRVHIALVEAVLGDPGAPPRERAYRVVTDNADCPGVDSAGLGPIPGERCMGRVILAWP